MEVACLVLIWAAIQFADHQVMKLLAPLMFAAAVLVFASEAGPISAILKWPPFVRIGVLSYSIYMLHIPVYECAWLVVSTLERLLHLQLRTAAVSAGSTSLIDLGSTVSNNALVAVLIGLILSLSVLTYRFIERPGQNIAASIARRIERRQPAAIAEQGRIEGGSGSDVAR
jgi:peptidoglycan/LPS O-acetylase OafA/YrhL